MVTKGWTDGRVEDLLNGLESGVSVNGEDRQLLNGEKGVLKVSAVTYGTFDPTAVKVIERQDELNRAKVNPRKSQIIISRSNTENLVGASAYINSDYPELFLPDKLWQTIPKPDANMKWLSYVLSSEPVRYTLSNLATGTSGSMKNITKGEFLSLRIGIPPLPEQQKIAKILSTWDKAISTTERLIDNSTQQKKALMQQLLTGKKRFGYKNISYDFQKTRYSNIPLDWAYPAIKDISVQLSKKNTDGKDYPVVSCSKHYGFVDSLDYFKKKVYSDDTSGYRIIPRNSFGFPSNHIEEGSIGLQTVHDIAIASPIYVVFKADPKLINNVYLYALLKTEHYRQIFCAATNASVDRRGSLRWKEFSAIRIPLPPLEEQQKIATVLTNADKEIELLEQQLADLQQEKKALMQVLLTGKKRVVVDGEVV